MNSLVIEEDEVEDGSSFNSELSVLKYHGDENILEKNKGHRCTACTRGRALSPPLHRLFDPEGPLATSNVASMALAGLALLPFHLLC